MGKQSDEELIALGEALATQSSDALTEHEVAIVELARRLKAAGEAIPRFIEELAWHIEAERKERDSVEKAWRTEVNRLNRLLAHTENELKVAQEKWPLGQLAKETYRREYLGEWSLSEPSPDYCLCLQPILTVSTTLCGNCGKRVGPLIPTATSSSNPDSGGK